MPYTKIGFANGDVLLASELNHIEDGIANLDTDKQDKLQGAPGQTVGFDSDGNVVIQDISGVTMTQVENYANQVSSAALSEAKSYSDTQISTHNSSNLSHEDIRNSISGITTSMETLNQEVENIASTFIGRNLVRNSAEMIGDYWSDTAESDNKYRSERSDGVWQWNLSNTGLTEDSWLSITVNCGDTAYPYLQVGDVFTCSVQYFVDSSKTPVDPSFYIEARGAGSSEWGANLTLNSDQIVQDKWTKISFTYTVTEETETILKLIFGLRKNGNVSFAHPKVEKGTVATDWSVAPEDSVNQNKIYTATLTTTDWQGSAPPYTQTITVNGLRASHNPTADISLSDSDTSENIKLKLTAWSLIDRLTTGNNTLTAYCYSKAPETEITLKLGVF